MTEEMVSNLTITWVIDIAWYLIFLTYSNMNQDSNKWAHESTVEWCDGDTTKSLAESGQKAVKKNIMYDDNGSNTSNYG
jgi:hypothetical protein